MQVVTPKVSVVMSVYKEPEDWLHQSIDSILNQTFKDFEFIIICDNPDYEVGISILKEYARLDNRIVLLFNAENIGLTKSLNKGLAIAKGDFIARMDADDICAKERIGVQVDYMQSHPEVDVCGSYITIFGNTTFFSERKIKYPEKHEDILTTMVFKNPFSHSSVLMKKSICGEKVQYDETTPKAQDYKLWCDLYEKGAYFANINKSLVLYRTSNSQISHGGNVEQKQTSDIVREIILKRLLGETSDEQVRLHNDTCKFQRTDSTLETRLMWLRHISDFLSSKKLLSPYIKNLLFSVWYTNCIEYSNLSNILRCPFISYSQLLNIRLIKELYKARTQLFNK